MMPKPIISVSSDLRDIAENLIQCLAELEAWLRFSQLNLNPGNSEMILVGWEKALENVSL